MSIVPLNEDTLIDNCQRLGIPLPLIACGGLGGWYASQGLLKKGITTSTGAAIGVDDVFTMDLSGSSTNRARYQSVYIANDMTVIARCKPVTRDANASCGPLNKMTGISNVTSEWCLGLNLLNSGTEYKPWFGICIGSTLYSALDPDTWAAGDRLTLAGVRRGQQVEIYRNGNLKNVAACGGGAINNVITDIQLGQWGSGGTFNLAAQFSVILIWDKALPSDLVAQLTADPWLLWRDHLPELARAGISIYTPSINQTWRFASVLSTQGFITRTITPGTSTSVPGGGRQTVSNGTIWHAYRDSTSLKCAYSTDNGTTWTVTTVGPTFALSSIAMCIGSGGYPVVVVSRTSNFDFYVYQWNGSSWVLKKQLSVTTDDTESMQIVYDGTTYHLISGSLVTSSGDRRIRYRSSTDLVTWSSASNVKDGDSSGTGPHKNRRVAACMGPSDVLHVAYSIRSGGEHRLYYRTRTAGSWGTAVQLNVGGSGNNVSDYQSGLSIAVDSSGKAHIVARIRNTAYTSRTKLRYYRISGSTVEVDEDVHDEVDADQGMPSISLNGSNPVVCWASAGLGLDTARARRDGAGTWTTDTIGTGSNVQTIHGPSFGTTYGYSRGVAGTMQGSEEWFASSDAVAGTGAQLENTWSFAGVLSTQQRLLANVWSFVSSLVASRSLTLRNTWVFSQLLSTHRPASMANTWVFQSVLTTSGPAQGWIQQTWHFNSALTGIKTPIKEINQTWQFESRLYLTKTGSFADTWYFSSILETVTHRQKAVTSTWTFVSTLRLNFTLKKLFTQTWRFVSSLLAMPADEGCEPDFTPERPIQASEDDVLHVYFIGPLPSPTLAVQLKRPEYGNVRRQSLQVRVNRTRSGGLKVHTRTPTYEPQTMLFEGNTLLKMEQVRGFLRDTKGRKVYYIDEQNRKWEGYIITSDVDLGVEARDKGGTFQLDFEGRLV